MSAPIGSVNQLVSVIQAQLSAGVRRAPSARAKPGKAPGRYARENLTALIEIRVNGIDPGDPQRGRKAFRVFLEAVLLSHFGEALANDPKFFQVVDDIQLTLESDAACGVLIESAIAQLLAPTR